MNVTQCRMARSALGWEIADLSDACGVDARTIARFEAGGAALPGQVRALRSAFVAHGVEIFDEGEQAGAVRYVETARAVPQPAGLMFS